MKDSERELTWLAPGDPFPPVHQAWGPDSGASGLLACGAALDVDSLCRAYSAGIFPWFSRQDPILWWSPDPRMVLQPQNFKLHPSLRKTVRKFRADSRCNLRFDTAFAQVIQACSSAPRRRQSGTWIVPEMVQAYVQLHEAGFAHSVEVWIDGVLQAGLYAVSIGKAVFGESMFTRERDLSKIALAALVAFSRAHGIRVIDCQQNTPHLASLGAAQIAREQFLDHLTGAVVSPSPRWEFDPVYWSEFNSPATPQP